MKLKSPHGIQHLNHMKKHPRKAVCTRAKIQNIYSFLSTRKNMLFLDKWISCQELLLENDQWIPSQGLGTETRARHPGTASVFELPAPLTWNKGNRKSEREHGHRQVQPLLQSAQGSQNQTEPPQHTVAHSWPSMLLSTTAKIWKQPSGPSTDECGACAQWSSIQSQRKMQLCLMQKNPGSWRSSC